MHHYICTCVCVDNTFSIEYRIILEGRPEYFGLNVNIQVSRSRTKEKSSYHMQACTHIYIYIYNILVHHCIVPRLLLETDSQ